MFPSIETMSLKLSPFPFITLKLLPHRKPIVKVIRSQDPTTNTEVTNGQNSEERKAGQSGVGFGPSSSISPVSTARKKAKSRREKGSIIRRNPVEKMDFSKSKEEEEKAEEFQRNANAFLLAWLGFGAIILVEGILLSASGFLPEEWDKLLVKYLYPSFTPTVFLFVAGTVAYGVTKYLQNEKFNRKS